VSAHYFIGISQQRRAGGLARLFPRAADVHPAWRVYPTRSDFESFTRPFLDLMAENSATISATLGPVLGCYGNSQELSVGLELEAGVDFNAASLAACVLRQARLASQDDAFIARVLPSDEWTDNARPGMTLLFREPRRVGSLRPLLARILSFPGGWPIDGFTTIPTDSGSFGTLLGLRYIFLPEVSLRWDTALRQRLQTSEEETEIIILDQATKIGRMCQDLAADPCIGEARLNWFDVIVCGIEEYDTIIPRLEAVRVPPAADPLSMTRSPFSELFELSSNAVLRVVRAADSFLLDGAA
jgi:hypothetical protein